MLYVSLYIIFLSLLTYILYMYIYSVYVHMYENIKKYIYMKKLKAL